MPKANRKPESRIQKFSRQLILGAATSVFASHGYRGATLDQIAARAEMSKTNLLYYFSSKQALYLATIESTLDVWLDSLERLDPDGNPETELRTYIFEKIKFSLENPAASRLFANEVLHGATHSRDILTRRLKVLMDDKSKALRRWMQSGKIVKVDPYNLIFIIFAATQTFADFAAQIDIVTGKSLADKRYFKQVAKDLEQVILRGIIAA
jgi:TetR/AcrR family transcriptional regulator